MSNRFSYYNKMKVKDHFGQLKWGLFTYCKLDDQRSYENPQALNDVTYHMYESCSDVDVLMFVDRTLRLPLHRVQQILLAGGTEERLVSDVWPVATDRQGIVGMSVRMGVSMAMGVTELQMGSSRPTFLGDQNDTHTETVTEYFQDL